MISQISNVNLVEIKFEIIQKRNRRIGNIECKIYETEINFCKSKVKSLSFLSFLYYLSQFYYKYLRKSRIIENLPKRKVK